MSTLTMTEQTLVRLCDVCRLLHSHIRAELQSPKSSTLCDFEYPTIRDIDARWYNHMAALKINLLHLQTSRKLGKFTLLPHFDSHTKRGYSYQDVLEFSPAPRPPYWRKPNTWHRIWTNLNELKELNEISQERSPANHLRYSVYIWRHQITRPTRGYITI